jgi:N-acetylneuraminic acid mutarotase
VIGAGAVESFQPTEGGRVRAVVGEGARRRVSRPARVELPARASGAVRLTDETSGMAIAFALEGAREVGIGVADGMALYAGALPGGADVVHRVHAEGTEDYVIFASKPDREELAYQVDVSGVAGLRLVSNVLEFLDAEGAPRLRVAPPHVVEAGGERHEAELAVEGCTYDLDPRGPWGRAVTAPPASRCALRVRWGDVAYPLLVDPRWTSTGTMNTGRVNHTASVLKSGEVLVAGGSSGGSAMAGAELYDPIGGTWSSTASMAGARASHTASMLESGEILVAGGFVNNGLLSSAELYDPTTMSWKPAGSLMSARSDHTASVLNLNLNTRKVLVAGGFGSTKALASAELYDPVSNAWSPTADMSVARYDHAASVLPSGRVLVAGGVGASSANLSSAEEYDPTGPTPKWELPTTMSVGRHYFTATSLLNGSVLVAGGLDGSITIPYAELYDPAARAWTPAASMQTPRAYHTATKLEDGRVLIAGGTIFVGPTPSTPLSSAELYDPSVLPPGNPWSATAGLQAARHAHTASLLSSGKVLVAGGAPGPLVSAELYASSPNGTACAQSAECASGFCADGVCCDTACNAGPCDACSVMEGADTNGTCKLLTGPPCDDGDACTRTDTCQMGVCTGKNPVACPAPDPCHDPGTCDPTTGMCSNVAKADGSSCDGGTCAAGICRPATGLYSGCAAAPASPRAPSPPTSVALAALVLLARRRAARLPARTGAHS